MKIRKKSLFYLLSILIIFTVIISGCDSPETENFITETDDVEGLSVINGTTVDEVISELNSERNELNVTLDNGNTVLADVIWEKDDEQEFDEKEQGPFTFKGKAIYEDLVKEVSIDVKVWAEFEIRDLIIDPDVITDETGAVDLSFAVENKSDYDCEQEIIIEIESASGDSDFDGQKVEEIKVELDANQIKVFEESIILLSVEDLLSYGFNIEDINGGWNVKGKTYNNSDSTQITVNISIEE